MKSFNGEITPAKIEAASNYLKAKLMADPVHEWKVATLYFASTPTTPVGRQLYFLPEALKDLKMREVTTAATVTMLIEVSLIIADRHAYEYGMYFVDNNDRIRLIDYSIRRMLRHKGWPCLSFDTIEDMMRAISEELDHNTHDFTNSLENMTYSEYCNCQYVKSAKDLMDVVQYNTTIELMYELMGMILSPKPAVETTNE